MQTSKGKIYLPGRDELFNFSNEILLLHRNKFLFSPNEKGAFCKITRRCKKKRRRRNKTKKQNKKKAGSKKKRNK